MTVNAPTPDLLEVAPALVRRLAVILGALAAVVARRFLREPALAGVIVPLWHRLTRVARRFEQAVLRPRPQRARGTRARKPPEVVPGVTPKPRLPGGKMWLVKVLGWEAAGYGSQLSALLAEPEMQAVLAAVPTVGRVFRPLCRMLGVTVPAVIAPAPVVRVRTARVRPVETEIPAPAGAWVRPRTRRGATWFRGPLFTRG